MSNVAVIGAQWGDEGKGKIIDWLANRAEMVVRFQGGNNAGHTIVVGEKTYKLSLLPSGVIQGKRSIIGNGVVVDPWSLLEEIARVGAAGVAVTPDLLVLAENAVLVLPIHKELDAVRESSNSLQRLGTTKRGIGRPMRTRSDAAPSASSTSRISQACRPRSSGCWRITTRCAAAPARRRSMPARSWPR